MRSASADEGGAEEVEALSCGAIRPLTRKGRVLFAGQPSEADLGALLEREGVGVVINLRTAEEVAGLGYDEASVVRGRGLRYEALGFGRGAPMELSHLTRLRALLAGGGGVILIHCASSNRVGALWLASRLADGVAWEAALAEAKAVGLRSEALMERARVVAEAWRASRALY